MAVQLSDNVLANCKARLCAEIAAPARGVLRANLCSTENELNAGCTRWPAGKQPGVLRCAQIALAAFAISERLSAVDKTR